ncbi:hypothetical protein J8273_6930 [Carpediemonas membranifera]|uniref:Uncharacterized protein n=1 Tax=Carpediemonas membranifera TaxID=201153 RepID=A0A8J6AXC7_9EUKA|nr:hypothetical protein J8273_6930 [Carpediemonas membranifera]|eukprot:KAG9390693.1 hypothetical protein J8273_6930 [Carpediemonas membranifera]
MSSRFSRAERVIRDLDSELSRSTRDVKTLTSKVDDLEDERDELLNELVRSRRANEQLSRQLSVAENRASKASITRQAVESRAAKSDVLEDEITALKKTIGLMKSTQKRETADLRRTMLQRQPYNEVRNKEEIRRLRSVLRGKGKLVDFKGITGVKRELTTIKDQNASITALLADIVGRREDRGKETTEEDDVELFINGAVFMGRSVVQLTETLASSVTDIIADAKAEGSRSALSKGMKEINAQIEECQAKARAALEDVLNAATTALDGEQLSKLDMLGTEVDLSPTRHASSVSRVKRMASSGVHDGMRPHLSIVEDDDDERVAVRIPRRARRKGERRAGRSMLGVDDL